MSNLLSVDPGIRVCGAAIFSDNMLVTAKLVVNPLDEGNRAAECMSMALAIRNFATAFHGISDLCVEWPQIYVRRIREGKTKEDPNDLLALTGINAAIATKLMTVPTSYLPQEWKGQVPKPKKGEKYIIETRMEDRISPSELRVAHDAMDDAGAKAHNVVDAIALGLFHLGRFNRHRVIPS